MNKNLVLLSSISASLFLQANAFAIVLSQADFQTIATIDHIGKQPEEQNEVISKIMNQAAENISIKADDFRSHFILGKAYDKLGMEELANDEYKKAESAGDPFKHFVLNALKTKVMASDFTDALSYYPFASKFFPADPSVAITHAIQLHSQGHIEEEEKLLSSVMASGTQEVGVMSALAAIKLEKREYEVALALFNRDLAQDPQYEAAILGKALVLSKLRRYGESLALALPLYRRGGWSNYELASLVSDNFAQLGIYEQAYQPALVSLAVARRQSEMDSAKRRVIFAWRHLSAQQRSEGLGEVSAVLDKTVFGARLHFALGDALQQAQYYSEAETQFRTGLVLEPKHARAYLHIAEIYETYHHKKSTAIINYLKYLHYSGGDPNIQLRLKRISEENSRNRDIALRLKTRLFSKSR